MATILTPDGYKDISTISVGDSVLSFDISGNQVTNIVEGIELINNTTYSEYITNLTINDIYVISESDSILINGQESLVKYINFNDIITIDGNDIEVKTIFRDKENQEFIPDTLTSYVINNNQTFCKYQSIYANEQIVHASELKIGDTLKDGNYNNFKITAITETVMDDWYRLAISDNHSYIIDDVLAHNASRFWVNGTGIWNASNTGNWSSTSGGASGSTVPTNADDVTFDSLSFTTGYTVTFAGAAPTCTNITIGNPSSGILTITNTSATLAIFGNSNFASGVTFSNGGSATITYNATSGTKTITSNGVQAQAQFTINGVGGTFQLQDDYLGGNTTGGNSGLNLTNGTFDPNGKTVNCSVQNNTATITGAWSFFNLTLNPNPVTALSTFNIISNISISNVFNPKGSPTLGRVILQNNVVGVPRTITCNGSVTGQYCDLMDITAAGTATWNLSSMSGGSGDCGGNSGITFTSGITCTSTGTTGFSWSSHGWSGRFPLPQDTVSIPNAFATGQTVTIDVPRAGGNVIFSCTGSPTLTSGFAFGSNVSFYGSLDFTGVGSIGSALTHVLRGRSSYTISSPTTMKTTQIEAPGGTYTFNSPIAFSAAFSLLDGTINDNNQTVTITTFTCATTTAGITRALTMGGTWTSITNNTTLWNVTSAAGFTLNCTGLLQCSYTGATGTRTISNLVAGISSALNVNVSGGTDIVTISPTSSNFIKNLDATSFSGTLNLSTANYSGNITLGSSVILGTTPYSLNFLGTSTQKIITNGQILPWSPTINGSGGTFQLQDNMAMNVGQTSGTITLTTGTLDLNGFNLTHNGIITTTGSNTRNFNIPSVSTYINVITGTSTVFNAAGTNFSMSGNGIFKISGSTTNIRTFAGGGFTYPLLWYTNNTANGELDIIGSNTFTGIKCIDTNGQTIKFSGGNTTTISSASTWTMNGSSAAHILLSGTGVFTLSCPYNNVISNFVTIANSNVIGGARWWANNSTNSGSTNGWRFGTPSNRQTNGRMFIF